MTQQELMEKIAHVLYDKKASDITVLSVSRMTVICDYMIIASGRSVLQVRSLSDDVEEALSEAGVTCRAKEGLNEGKWVVLDYGTVLVHIFHPEDREFYRLERLWDDGSNRILLPFMKQEEDS